MHIYLHGFASSGSAEKGKILMDFFAGREKVISPDFPDEPFGAIRAIEKLLTEYAGQVTLWGSSLGGFYALYFASVKGIKSVLINPALKPWIGLLDFVGTVRRNKTEDKFEWKKEYISQLEIIGNDIKVEKIVPEKLTLMLAKDDVLLNYQDTLNFLKGYYGKLILEENSGHELRTFEEILKREYPG